MSKFKPARNQSEANCRKKRPYASERIARREASRLVGVRDLPLFVYKCQHCKQWHMTKQKPEWAANGPTKPTADGFTIE